MTTATIKTTSATLPIHPALTWATPSVAGKNLTLANMNKKQIRILLVDDHPIVRKGIASCLARCANLVIVGEAGDGRDGLRLARELRPDVVLCDIEMPHLDGLALAETLCRELPGVRVLILSMHGNPEYIVRILQSGARGYVLKDAPTEDLIKAIETVQGGETYFSGEVARVALSQFVRGQTSTGNGQSPLTPREKEVLVQIAEGLSNKEIACCLNVGVRTVETHRERIMRKLDIHSIAGLTKYAVARGMVTLPKDPSGAVS